jgi:hypothetical protein
MPSRSDLQRMGKSTELALRHNWEAIEFRRGTRLGVGLLEEVAAQHPVLWFQWVSQSMNGCTSFNTRRLARGSLAGTGSLGLAENWPGFDGFQMR